MSQESEKNTILQVIAITAILFFLWRLFRKKNSAIFVDNKEPITTAPEMANQFIGQPLNCEEISSPWRMFASDNTIEGEYFGHSYADEQAQAYSDMKQTEAVRNINKKVIQFRLINSTATKAQARILNTTTDPEIINGTFDNPLPATIPVATAATSITISGFIANWVASSNAIGYFLDVATDSGFLSYVTGYIAKGVGNVVFAYVTGLNDNTTYYYRLRAYNTIGITTNSNIIAATTLATVITDYDGNVYTSVVINNQEWLVQNLKTTRYADGTPIDNGYSDWFLPSRDELIEMRNELYLYSVGGFTDTSYWTSTEANNSNATVLLMIGGLYSNPPKTGVFNVRACRAFTSTVGAYNLRDMGPAGGLIFHIDVLGTTYYEAAPSDQSASQIWSNIDNVEIGVSAQGTAIGTGQSNTLAIVSQIGQTDSAAKLCDDLGLGGWGANVDGAYCWYNNSVTNKATYGGLYNWYAVNNIHSLALAGWRIPTDADWTALTTYLGGIAVAGGKLKETGTTHWNGPNTGATNSSGFTALPGGYRDNTGIDHSITGHGDWWSSSQDTVTTAWYRYMEYNNAAVSRGSTSKQDGLSVRCMRDI